MEKYLRVKAYVKNHNLGLEVPYRHGSDARIYLPDFIGLIDDSRGDNDLLHLIVEIKGYRREDAKDKKLTIENYWIPGVNKTGQYGRWAFAEFKDVYAIGDELERKITGAVNEIIKTATTKSMSLVTLSHSHIRKKRICMSTKK